MPKTQKSLIWLNPKKILDINTIFKIFKIFEKKTLLPRTLLCWGALGSPKKIHNGCAFIHSMEGPVH